MKNSTRPPSVDPILTTAIRDEALNAVLAMPHRDIPQRYIVTSSRCRDFEVVPIGNWI
jgi:hypothetical protein